MSLFVSHVISHIFYVIYQPYDETEKHDNEGSDEQEAWNWAIKQDKDTLY